MAAAVTMAATAIGCERRQTSGTEQATANAISSPGACGLSDATSAISAIAKKPFTMISSRMIEPPIAIQYCASEFPMIAVYYFLAVYRF